MFDHIEWVLMIKFRQFHYLTFIRWNALVILFSINLYPQPAKFIKYSTHLGLSSGTQRCVVQDHEGFIWIGTEDGLNRFDGRSFKEYRKTTGDSTSLRSNLINCMFVDNKGVLWIGTNHGGLSRYIKETDNFQTYTNNINDITTITEDKYHRLWVGTNSLGLHYFNPNANGFTRYQAPLHNVFDSTNISFNQIDCIKADGETLWISYSKGILAALNSSTFTLQHFKLFDVSSLQTLNYSVNSLVIDKNIIWVSTWSKGIWLFNKSTGRCTPYTKEKSKYINFVFLDSKKRIWYSPESQGLVMIEGNKKITYQSNDYDQNSLSTNSLSNIFQDRQGNLWLTSKRGDLNYFILDNPFYTWYKNPNPIEGLTSNLITAIMEDSRRRIWVGYEDGGIDLLDSKCVKQKMHFTGDQHSGLGPGPIMTFYESTGKTIWIGKYRDGLKKYNETTKSFLSYQHIEGDERTIAGNDIRSISEDRHKNLWIAIHGGGVDKFNPLTGEFVHHKSSNTNISNTLLSDWTFSAVCDKNDNVWIGTVSGVSVLSETLSRNKQFTTNLPDGHNLSDDVVRNIFFDSKGFVWIGSFDGLNKLNLQDNTIQKYFSKDGLPNNVITAILEDSHYNLWISTAKGLSKFSPEKETFHNYYVYDGLVTDNFNASSSFKNPDGEMYFGGRNGLNRFHPDSIKINTFQPPVYITNFKLFNRSVPARNSKSQSEFTLPQQINFCKEIILNYDQNVITLEFIALNYISLEKNQYRYKLIGFEKDWSPPGYKRDVTYTNLRPGEYIFRVIASNNDGIWNTEGAALKIIVLPPFWRTSWAYGFYVILILAMLYLFKKWILHEAKVKRKIELEELEIKKLHEMDTLKNQFFSNVSHEFRTPLTLIIGPLQKLLESSKNEAKKSQVKLVQRNANRLLRLINQLMDFRKIEEAGLALNLSKNDIVLFSKEISSAFNQEARERKITYSYVASHPTFDVWFDTDKLDKIIYNLLSNAFKYTPDNGAITISLSLDDNTDNNTAKHSEGSVRQFRITVQDSGIGIPKEYQSKIFDRFYQVKNTMTTHGTGIGLSLTYELVKLHQGNSLVHSELGIGSEFSVILPLWLEEQELPQSSMVNKSLESEIMQDDDKDQNDVLTEESSATSKLPHVLIIEDNTDMRLFIKSDLLNIYSCSEAKNGFEGIDKAIKEIPDVILCDIMMPGIDGFEVCRKLKQDERTSHIPIIMLTAKSSEQHTIEGLESGADDYIAKPSSSAILRARIKNLINSRQLLRKKFIKEPFAPIQELSPSKVDERLFKKAYEIVERNLNNPDFDVSDFGRELGMSRTQLYRKIHAVSGQSVKEFIRIIRLKKAAELLLKREKNISEVAFTVGFNSLSYFTTSFTEYFGMNPKKYIDKFIK